MGLLALGTPLAWPEAKQKADQVRDWGIEQLLTLWGKAKGKERDALLWGDEIEYIVACFDDENRRVRLSLRQADILHALANDEQLKADGGGVPELDAVDKKTDKVAPVFHPEFGRFMLEATPGKPWGIGLKDLLEVEHDMKRRRVIAKDHMAPTEAPITMTTFPLLGLPDTLRPAYEASGEKLRSQFVPDEIANPHIRFPTLAANIRSRRGRKVELNVPVFRDEKTKWPFEDPTVNYDLHHWPEDDDVRKGAVKPNSIYMDAMAFGMGSCCLQITFQAKNIEEGRKMYDQLSPLGPIFLALTAATPIYKGFLADTDVRWNQISAAVDDRTAEELGEAPLKNQRWRIPKSRYASNSTYISQDPRLRKEYFDPDLVVDEALKKRLVAGGMDELLATHFAHLFIRDPIVIFDEDLRQLDAQGADHFENLQSTNWQHMRFKPPPPGSDIGWRVEFRPMEIQATDFENAAFSVFLVLVTRAILSFDLNFYIPIARTTQNMETAHRRDAVLNDRFWFRKQPLPPRRRRSPNSSANASRAASPNSSSPSTSVGPEAPIFGAVEDEYREMSINEIINGTAATRSAPSSSAAAADGNDGDNDDNADEQTEDNFPGLLPLVEAYLSTVNVDVETRCELARYLDLVRRRANGSLWTGARWMRHFVRGHPEYQKDSVVPAGVAYELCKVMEAVARGEGAGEKGGLCWEMLGGRR